jgi:hypothetical protein
MPPLTPNRGAALCTIDYHLEMSFVIDEATDEGSVSFARWSKTAARTASSRWRCGPTFTVDGGLQRPGQDLPRGRPSRFQPAMGRRAAVDRGRTCA